MNIGVIIHSSTGTSLKFGRLIAGKLTEKGHKVEVIHLKVDGEPRPGSTGFKITNIPDCKNFDSVLIGGPVIAFSASPVISMCLKSLKNISGKKVLPFVTHFFPLNSMGGNQALSQMKNAITSSGATALPGSIVPKMFHNQEKMMEQEAVKIAALLS
jgi:hypothetical protein